MDKAKCEQLFWQFFPKLAKSITITNWDFDYNKRKTPYAPFKVIFENTEKGDAFGCDHNHNVNWEEWFKQALIVDPTSKMCYKIKAGADLSEISQKMTEIHKSKQYYKKGEQVFPWLLEKYASLFEKVDDEPFKRLCVLMLVQWGINSYQPDNLFYVEKGENKPIDLDLLEKGINNFLIPMEQVEVQSR